jgi:hypothetical protein
VSASSADLEKSSPLPANDRDGRATIFHESRNGVYNPCTLIMTSRMTATFARLVNCIASLITSAMVAANSFDKNSNEYSVRAVAFSGGKSQTQNN